ncbi:uncharacterized protein F4807DRAFT_457261 [Annulohypoxylon truncatum]|uniref:uncharacterized protein n=1 Tax=Annulohypoxylon truncatum TaxID=327061 RepID=UPI00200743E2|nr:uncharacterized protein F4807DRAFT_457261 [Annulohypoxylon truncatum]KAI1213175.1 hypothetical protein F4807DRAFT_457261 [Annulohypoxylon truncatum]
MKVSSKTIITVAPLVLALVVNGSLNTTLSTTSITAATPSPSPSSLVSLPNHINALDAAGQISWTDVDGGRAAILQQPSTQKRDDIWNGFADPPQFIHSVWNALHADIEVQNYDGRAMCPAGGSHMAKALVDSSAKLACRYFVKQSVVGELGLKVWHAYEVHDDQVTSDGPGFIRWLLGSVTDHPAPLTEDFCSDLWDAVKSMCVTAGTIADTQGQVVEAGDWMLYADPTSNKNNT